jgi:hypothetical protein
MISLVPAAAHEILIVAEGIRIVAIPCHNPVNVFTLGRHCS